MASSAQTNTQHQPKAYVDSLGNLYWNKHQPFYLRIASSPTDTGRVLESKKSAQFVNPTYFDTEGANYIRTRYAVDPETKKRIVPQQEIMWEIQADGTAPALHTEFIGAKHHKRDNTAYYGKNLQVEISATDKGAGVEEVYFSTPQQSFTTYGSAINFGAEGKQLVRCYSVDKVGNVSDTLQKTFVVDHSAPVTAHNVKGDMLGTIIEAKSTIELLSKDPLSGTKKIYYKIKDSVYSEYKGKSISLAKLSDGNYTITYHAEDHVGNKEAEKNFNFYIDKLPPILASDILGDRFIVNDQIYFSGRTKLKLTAVDNKSGVEDVMFSIDKGEFKSYDQPFYLPSVPGLHVIRYYAVDKMKNRTGSYSGVNSKFQEYEHNVSKIYVDLTGPSMSYSFIGDLFRTRDTVFVNTKTKIKISASDKESGLQYISYSVNNVQAETNYTAPFSLENEGENKIEIFGYDNVNNRNRDEFLVVVDDSGPQVIGTFSILPLSQKNNLAVYPKQIILYLAATDNIIGTDKILYSLNGAPMRTYKGAVKGFKKGELNTVKVMAIDKLKNSNTKEISFYLE